MKAQKFTLLIVDDDEDHRFLFKKAFEGLGTRYKVQLAANGEQAIAYLKGEGEYADRAICGRSDLIAVGPLKRVERPREYLQD